MLAQFDFAEGAFPNGLAELVASEDAGVGVGSEDGRWEVIRRLLIFVGVHYAYNIKFMGSYLMETRTDYRTTKLRKDEYLFLMNSILTNIYRLFLSPPTCPIITGQKPIINLNNGIGGY